MLKFPTITTPGGLILHSHGAIDRRFHHGALYVNLAVESQLETVCSVEGQHGCIQGNKGYNRGQFSDAPLHSTNLSTANRSEDKAINSVRVKMEWMYKRVKLY